MLNISWRQLAERIGKLLREEKYLTEADRAMSDEEVAAGNNIGLEDIDSVFLSQPRERRMEYYKALLNDDRNGTKRDSAAERNIQAIPIFSLTASVGMLLFITVSMR